MKKIVSLLLAVAVVLCLGVTSFATNAAPFSFKEDVKTVSVGEGTEDVTLVLKIDFDTTVSNGSMAALMMEYDTSKLTLTSVNSEAFPIPYSSSGSELPNGLVTFANDGDPSAVYEIAAGTIEIPLTFAVDKSVEADYPIVFNPENTMILDIDGNPINDCTTYPTATISVKAAAPAVKTIEKTDSKIVESATTIGDKTTDTQIGAAVGIQFKAPDGVALQNQMIWAVQTSDGRKYSKPVAVDFGGVSGTVTVAATFHNGIHENSFSVAPVAPLEITGVDAIFTDGTNDYFTNAADKDAKAE